ncbi:MAG: glutaredoxin family protein [Actinobacteria bacterium]|nr:glutaredoxin family protein [Actinomycetota bacterium]
MTLTLGSGRRRRRVTVEVYTREGCRLCEEAEDRAAAEARGAIVRLIDIDQDPELQARYDIRVPVVVVDGREVAEGRLEPGVVRQAIRHARRGRWAEWRRA